MTTEKEETKLTYDDLIEMQNSEIKPIKARYRKLVRVLQKNCPHITTEKPLPNPRFFRCLECHKIWEEAKSYEQ